MTSNNSEEKPLIPSHIHRPRSNPVGLKSRLYMSDANRPTMRKPVSLKEPLPPRKKP